MYSHPDLPWVAHKILVTAQVLGFGIWIGLWPWACQKASFVQRLNILLLNFPNMLKDSSLNTCIVSMSLSMIDSLLINCLFKSKVIHFLFVYVYTFSNSDFRIQLN